MPVFTARRFLLLLALAGLLAGCGGDDGAKPAPGGGGNSGAGTTKDGSQPAAPKTKDWRLIEDQSADGPRSAVGLPKGWSVTKECSRDGGRIEEKFALAGDPRDGELHRFRFSWSPPPEVLKPGQELKLSLEAEILDPAGAKGPAGAAGSLEVRAGGAMPSALGEVSVRADGPKAAKPCSWTVPGPEAVGSILTIEFAARSDRYLVARTFKYRWGEE